MSDEPETLYLESTQEALAIGAALLADAGHPEAARVLGIIGEHFGHKAPLIFRTTPELVSDLLGRSEAGVVLLQGRGDKLAPEIYVHSAGPAAARLGLWSAASAIHTAEQERVIMSLRTIDGQEKSDEEKG